MFSASESDLNEKNQSICLFILNVNKYITRLNLRRFKICINTIFFNVLLVLVPRIWAAVTSFSLLFTHSQIFFTSLSHEIDLLLPILFILCTAVALSVIICFSNVSA